MESIKNVKNQVDAYKNIFTIFKISFWALIGLVYICLLPNLYVTFQFSELVNNIEVFSQLYGKDVFDFLISLTVDTVVSSVLFLYLSFLFMSFIVFNPKLHSQEYFLKATKFVNKKLISMSIFAFVPLVSMIFAMLVKDVLLQYPSVSSFLAVFLSLLSLIILLFAIFRIDAVKNKISTFVFRAESDDMFHFKALHFADSAFNMESGYKVTFILLLPVFLCSICYVVAESFSRYIALYNLVF
ncbi:hypothetical protein [Vibrio vulnificus]|uniref:Uncharacterized protein n=1 Tax=Vibrio vulnificus TaxID=672 RepID=A0ABX4WXY5_VIBVL|nr:hypothetical protein [Vibrio vulnificus]EGQ9939708.1 hypothetical protein [Vibrio vulnificus]KHF81669.1 hypothetical protein OA15_21660 [Vibrio vulnificus]KHF93416.1 hypothetical protein OA14_20920 [Vibrio vulnificus]MCU8278023.1 hypothetical protein [Vibrio vulnificus]MCU8536117.1 hypothetical protein [Vibrio vulnificus]